MKLGTFSSGLTHVLFLSLIAMVAAKSARGPDPAVSDATPGQEVRTAQARIPAATASMTDAGQNGSLPVSEDPAPPPETEATREEAAPEAGKPEHPETEPKEARPKRLTRNERLMRRLVAAYPDFLAGYDDNAIIWHDGTRMPFDDGREKTFKQRLADPDLEDQFYAEYPRGLRGVPPLENVDPGRVRYEPFFTKMYGNCKRNGGAVTARLEKVVWLPEHYGKTLRVTRVNGVADALRKVSKALDELPRRFMKYLKPSAGTFHCRTIAGTERFSVHAFGAAVDINAKYGDYWRWSGAEPGEPLTYRNRIPWDIVEIFEQHGFIWGGKWYHYDTLHFEYRPELLNAAPAPEPDPAPVPAKRPAPEQRAAR